MLVLATDGVVTLRRATPADSSTLRGGRDAEFHRWLGPGQPDPRPTACIEVAGATVGWVDYDDDDREWLRPGEVNLGYNVFAEHRGQGYAARGVQLLMHHLSVDSDRTHASLLIDPGNERSLRVAARTRFVEGKGHKDQRYFVRPIPPTTYTDGVVTIRPQQQSDIAAGIDAIDEEQITWMWLPAEQRGPKWGFSVDTPGVQNVAYVDCDLANPHVPAGQANVSYSSHPDHRRKGYVVRAVGLVIEFLRDHTAAQEAHIVIDVRNVASLAVARAAGARVHGGWVNDLGATMVRHVVRL